MAMPQLWLLTHLPYCSGRENMIEVVRAAAANGLGGVILRDKDLPFDQRLELGRRLWEILQSENPLCQLAIHSDKELAQTLPGARLHVSALALENLKGEDSPCGLGVSVHSALEASAALQAEADLLLVSHIYPTDSKKGLAPKGPRLLQRVRALAPKAFLLALGGIQPQRVAPCIEAGADGVAVMSALLCAPDPEAATQAFIQALQQAAAYQEKKCRPLLQEKGEYDDCKWKEPRLP